MPPRHHRTVDRIVSIMETVARDPRGLTLTELAAVLDVPKSSVQGLVNGMSATGLLAEHGKRYFLGPTPFVVTLINGPVEALGIRQEDLEGAAGRVGLPLNIAIQVGDGYVSLAMAGDHAAMNYSTRSHRRGPLLRTAAGKIILASMPDGKLHQYLMSFSGPDVAAVNGFLQELAAIRASGLAFNHGATVPGIYAVATGLYNDAGEFVAALCAIGRSDVQERLPAIGARLQSEASSLGLKARAT